LWCQGPSLFASECAVRHIPEGWAGGGNLACPTQYIDLFE